jgi:hypothetical protein
MISAIRLRYHPNLLNYHAGCLFCGAVKRGFGTGLGGCPEGLYPVVFFIPVSKKIFQPKRGKNGKSTLGRLPCVFPHRVDIYDLVGTISADIFVVPRNRITIA